MKLIDIYKTAYTFGMQNDPRGEKETARQLKDEKANYEALSDKEKTFYDIEKLKNPYADSRIVFDSGKNISSVLVGIDMEAPEILLADRLNEKGVKIDAVIAHHPEANAYTNFYEVMDMQADIFNRLGVSISTAQDMLSKRKREVAEKLMPANHYRVYDAARLLNISMLNFHTPADNCVATYLQKIFDKEKPTVIEGLMDLLMEIPEYIQSSKRGVPPMILVGDKKKKVQKVFVDMTGGTSGPKEIYKRLSLAGIDTLVGMHFSDDHKKAIEEAGMHAVIAGHISSDNLGMNLVLDEIEKKCGTLKIHEASGFTRIKRK